MTVALVDSTKFPQRSVGNGVTTVFPFQYKILAKTDIKVYVAGILKTVDLDYSVTGFNSDAGGNVTFLLGAPANGASVIILRSMAQKRTTDYQQLGDFLSPVVNPDFDNAVLLIQDLAESDSRALHSSILDPLTSTTIDKTSFLGQYLTVNGSGAIAPASGTGNDTALRTDLANTATAGKGNELFSYRRTAAEIAALIVPVNYTIPSHDVCGIALAERYQNNTTPLTTDMGPGLQNAVKVGIQAGCDAGYISDCRIATTVNIDRIVDAANRNFWFTLHGFGKQLYVDTAIPLFSSTIPYTTAPVTQLVKFDNCSFTANAAATNCFVLDGARYLRTAFVNCSGTKIRLVNSTTYLQSIYLINCEFRNWIGYFMDNNSTVAYDIQVIGGMYEGGADGFHLKTPTGCKFWTQIENCSGVALTLPDSKGVDISCYMEANGVDMDFRTGNTHCHGVNIHGTICGVASGYSIKWGTADGCTSKGNWCTTNMHDLATDSNVDINDYAATSLSTKDAQSNGGYRQSTALSLNVRGVASAGYTWAIANAKYTRMGNRLIVEFIGTLTSTGTNAADQVFINSGLPFDASAANFLCGSVEVVGSTTNNGLSSLFISQASPAQLKSSINVIPANTVGNSFSVRGQISYITA